MPLTRRFLRHLPDSALARLLACLLALGLNACVNRGMRERPRGLTDGGFATGGGNGTGGHGAEAEEPHRRARGEWLARPAVAEDGAGRAEARASVVRAAPSAQAAPRARAAARAPAGSRPRVVSRAAAARARPVPIGAAGTTGADGGAGTTRYSRQYRRWHGRRGAVRQPCRRHGAGREPAATTTSAGGHRRLAGLRPASPNKARRTAASRARAGTTARAEGRRGRRQASAEQALGRPKRRRVRSAGAGTEEERLSPGRRAQLLEPRARSNCPTGT